MSVSYGHVLIRFSKGKLRKQDPIDLGEQYSGSRISREALEAEGDDDPFKANSDDEDEEGEDESDEEDMGSDEAISENEESDNRNGVTPRSGKKEDIDDSMESDASEGDEKSNGLHTDDDDESDASSDGETGSQDDSDGSDNGDPSKGASSKPNDREEIRRLMASDQKTIAASISQAATADAVKGQAVKHQRSTFDALLNARIKLQKGITAMNQLPINSEGTGNIEEGPVKSAESAALALWSSIEDLRLALAGQTEDGSKKRKRSPSLSTSSLWERMTDLESTSSHSRRKVLDKWSLKVRGTSATIPNARGKLLGSSTGSQQTMSTFLDAQVATETRDRAAKRSRNINKPNGSTDHDNVHNNDDSEPIYDDTIFYQSLLRDLVEQRMSSSDSITNGLDTLNINLPSRLSIHPVTGMRNDKTKKPVDTRASKGRKIRYNVHEKLQNFMAPEIRGSWTDRARDEFFASLLGKTASGLLQENENDADSEEEDEDDENRVEGGLRLFRT